MNIRAETPQPSVYAPPKPNPIRLAGATIRAVDQLGVVTSDEIDKTADEIVRGAAEIAEKLRGLAEAIREHTKVANEHVTEFCNKATSVLEGVQELQQKLRMNRTKHLNVPDGITAEPWGDPGLDQLDDTADGGLRVVRRHKVEIASLVGPVEFRHLPLVMRLAARPVGAHHL